MVRQAATLVVLPGLDGTDVFFRPFLAALPKSVDATVVSYPQTANGYGDLLRVVRRAVAGLDAFFVLGSSFSGPLAVALAAAEPHRVRGIILSATFLRSPKLWLRPLRHVAVAPTVWMIRAARRVPIWTLRREDDPWRLAKAETWARVSARCLAARVRAVLTADVRDTLRACAQPVLCIVYEQDTVVPRANADEILRHSRAARRVMLPGGHLALHADPVSLARAVEQFLRETMARSAGTANR